MREEGSKTLVIIGTVLGAICALACLGGTAFFFFGLRLANTPVTAPVSVTASAPVPAPAAPAVTVLLLSDGGVIFDDVPVTDAELTAALTKRFDSGGDAEVVLYADERVSHGRAVQIMDLTKQAGFTRIAFGVSAK